MDITSAPDAINLNSLSRELKKQVKAKRKRYTDRPVYHRDSMLCVILAGEVGTEEYGRIEKELHTNGWSMVIG